MYGQRQRTTVESPDSPRFTSVKKPKPRRQAQPPATSLTNIQQVLHEYAFRGMYSLSFAELPRLSPIVYGRSIYASIASEDMDIAFEAVAESYPRTPVSLAPSPRGVWFVDPGSRTRCTAVSTGAPTRSCIVSANSRRNRRMPTTRTRPLGQPAGAHRPCRLLAPAFGQSWTMHQALIASSPLQKGRLIILLCHYARR